METQLLRLPDVRQATGLGRSTIYALIAQGRFPSPIKVSERATAWVGKEVNAWIEQRIAESRKSVA
jgi:prophage regulatory protein